MKWMNDFVCMVHDVLGTSPGQQIHWYFTKRKTVWGKHVCTVNVWDWLAGPPGKREEERMGGLMDGPGSVPVLLWTEWVSRGNIPLVFPQWQCEDGAGRKFLPVCLAPRLGVLWSCWGLGFDQIEREGLTCHLLVCDPGTKTPPGHRMTGAFFGVFGAATKCAMCYVAWFFFFFFTSYKAHL